MCRPVAQLFSFVGIDVAHHQRHIVLDQIVKARSLLENTTDHFMRNLDSALLIRALRIAVEYPGSAFSVSSELNGQGICEFTSSV